MHYKSRYFWKTPGAVEALEQIAEQGAQEKLEECRTSIQKSTHLHRRLYNITKNATISAGIGAVLGYLSTGDAEGAQQGALTGASASAFFSGTGITLYSIFEKKFKNWALREAEKNATPLLYKMEVDQKFADAEFQEYLLRKWSLTYKTGNAIFGAGVLGVLYAVSSGAVDTLFGTNFSSLTAAYIGMIDGVGSAFIGQSKNNQKKQEEVQKIKAKLEAVIAANTT